MGFDLYGLRAVSKRGEYFRNNVWWWRPLAYFVIANCKVSSPKDWGYNNGKEVSQKEALAIAKRLKELIRSGQVKKYSLEYAKELKRLPLEKCKYCEGTGKIEGSKCNACSGKGKSKNFATFYPFSVSNIRDFAAFCEKSGGFTIC